MLKGRYYSQKSCFSLMSVLASSSLEAAKRFIVSVSPFRGTEIAGTWQLKHFTSDYWPSFFQYNSSKSVNLRNQYFGC